jgi:hypothetical protein
VVMSTPTAIKNMDCSTCKAFDPASSRNRWGDVTSGTCHRHAPVIVDKDYPTSQAPFPVVYLPEFCLEYIPKDMETKMPDNPLASLPAWH